MSSSKAKTSREGRNLILTRIIDAPREKVFKPWTDPDETVVCAAAVDNAAR